MKWTRMPAGDINGFQQRLLVALGDDIERVVERSLKDQKFVEEIAGYIVTLAKAVRVNTSPERAKEIMGKNFFGLEEAAKYFGVNPTPDQRAVLSAVPFSEEELAEVKDTHILVCVFPMSILEIRGIVGPELFYNDEEEHQSEPFVNECDEAGWRLVQKTEIANEDFLGENNEIPSAQLVVYTVLGYYFSTGEQLFPDVYVQTASMHTDGYNVYVGIFDANGLSIDGFSGVDNILSYVGFASTRKVK